MKEILIQLIQLSPAERHPESVGAVGDQQRSARRGIWHRSRLGVFDRGMGSGGDSIPEALTFNIPQTCQLILNAYTENMGFDLRLPSARLRNRQPSGQHASAVVHVH